jgi:hypothetical protein
LNLRCPDPAAESLLRLLAGQALSRAGGAPLAAIGVLWPLAIALPLALLAFWSAVSLLVRAHELRDAGRRQS